MTFPMAASAAVCPQGSAPSDGHLTDLVRALGWVVVGYADDTGTLIPLSQIEPGDLLFYANPKDGIHHVALYLGNGKMIDAPDFEKTGPNEKQVQIQSQTGICAGSHQKFQILTAGHWEPESAQTSKLLDLPLVLRLMGGGVSMEVLGSGWISARIAEI